MTCLCGSVFSSSSSAPGNKTGSRQAQAEYFATCVVQNQGFWFCSLYCAPHTVRYLSCCLWNGSPVVFSLCFWSLFFLCVHSSTSRGLIKGRVRVCLGSVLLFLKREERMQTLCYCVQRGRPQPFWAVSFLVNIQSVFPHSGSPGSSCFLLTFWPSPDLWVRSDSLSSESFTWTFCLWITTGLVDRPGGSISCLVLHQLFVHVFKL